MKCLILAAGYATRLYPLTENFPKPLLEVGGKPILDWLIEDIDSVVGPDGSPLVDEYVVVSNHKFAGIFDAWAAERPAATGKGPGHDPQGADDPGIACPNADPAAAGKETARALQGADDPGIARPNADPAATGKIASILKGADEPAATDKGPVRVPQGEPGTGIACPKACIRVIDDGSVTNEGRLGAVRDIQLGIEAIAAGCEDHESGLAGDDLLVIAGDNLLSFSLGDFISYARTTGTTCLMRYYEADPARLRKSGVAEVDACGLVLSMEEKPAQPKGNWCCPPFYYIASADVPKVAEGIAAGCGTDAPGSFLAWLCTRTRVHAWEMPGPRYDIGTLESYEAVKRVFEGK